jgi:hypothetical protein
MRSRQNVSAALSAIVILLVTGRATPAQGPPADSPAAVVARAAAAHGKVAGADPVDSVADGRVTLYTMQGPKITFDITIMRKGMRAVQRIIKQPPVGDVNQGTDGTRSWESFHGFFTPAAKGRALQFIESQTGRSSASSNTRQRGSRSGMQAARIRRRASSKRPTLRGRKRSTRSMR